MKRKKTLDLDMRQISIEAQTKITKKILITNIITT